MMPTFTREQLEALIDYIDAKIDDKRLDSDLQESIRLSRCAERLEGLFLGPPIVMSCDELEHFRENFTTGEQQQNDRQTKTMG